eukprot:12409607-Karenia_brevis.AAC.1
MRELLFDPEKCLSLDWASLEHPKAGRVMVHSDEFLLVGCLTDVLWHQLQQARRPAYMARW